MLTEKYLLNQFYIATVMYGSAGCEVLILDKGNNTYYDLIHNEMINSTHKIRYKLPLTKYVKANELKPNMNYYCIPSIERISKKRAKKLANSHYEEYHKDYIKYVNSDEYKNSLDQDLPVPPISIT